MHHNIGEVARDVMKQHSLTREDLKTSLKAPDKNHLSTFTKVDI